MPIYSNGTRHKIVIHFRGRRKDYIHHGSKAEAKRIYALKRLELESADPETIARVALRFRDFAEGPYRTHAKAHLKKRTWSNRTYTIANLADFFGDDPLHEITVARVDEYKAERTRAGISATTINDELKVLRAILSHARELGATFPEPRFRDMPTHGVKRRARPWTAEEVDRLLTATRHHSPEIFGLVVFLLNTGCRKGEAIALERANVDHARGLIRIVPGAEWQPKNGEAREIPIASALLPFLSPEGPRHVFTNERCERWAYWPQRSFDRAREAAKLTGGPHTTRHTYASHFLAQCPDLYLLGKILGHSTQYVTELYAHLLPEHLARARNVVNFGQGLGKVSKQRTRRNAKQPAKRDVQIRRKTQP